MKRELFVSLVITLGNLHAAEVIQNPKKLERVWTENIVVIGLINPASKVTEKDELLRLRIHKAYCVIPAKELTERNHSASKSPKARSNKSQSINIVINDGQWLIVSTESGINYLDYSDLPEGVFDIMIKKNGEPYILKSPRSRE